MLALSMADRSIITLLQYYESIRLHDRRSNLRQVTCWKYIPYTVVEQKEDVEFRVNNGLSSKH